MSDPNSWYYEINGKPVTAEQLMPLVLSNYGHFTAMQIRDGATRGIGFHLARLDEATKELFGARLPGDRVRGLIRQALGDRARAASVRVTVFRPTAEAEVSLLVTVRPPVEMPQAPQSLMSVPYQRPVAHLKHLGGFGQGYYGRLAEAAGFDDALLTGPDGVICEGAITNIAFLAGDQVVWPAAPALDGIAKQVLERELAAAGVPSIRRTVRLADVGSYDGSLIMNSWGLTQLARIDDMTLPLDSPLAGLVARVFAAAPWDAV
jgi:branched-subunit amino acid aminotransferase/4-amino-4-deoxychorismate lyase